MTGRRKKHHQQLVDLGRLVRIKIQTNEGPKTVLGSKQTIKQFHNIPLVVHLVPDESKSGFSVTDPVTGLAIGKRCNDTPLDALMQAVRLLRKECRTLERFRELQREQAAKWEGEK